MKHLAKWVSTFALALTLAVSTSPVLAGHGGGGHHGGGHHGGGHHGGGHHGGGHHGGGHWGGHHGGNWGGHHGGNWGRGYWGGGGYYMGNIYIRPGCSWIPGHYNKKGKWISGYRVC